MPKKMMKNAYMASRRPPVPAGRPPCAEGNRSPAPAQPGATRRPTEEEAGVSLPLLVELDGVGQNMAGDRVGQLDVATGPDVEEEGAQVVPSPSVDLLVHDSHFAF